MQVHPVSPRASTHAVHTASKYCAFKPIEHRRLLRLTLAKANPATTFLFVLSSQLFALQNHTCGLTNSTYFRQHKGPISTLAPKPTAIHAFCAAAGQNKVQLQINYISHQYFNFSSLCNLRGVNDSGFL